MTETMSWKSCLLHLEGKGLENNKEKCVHMKKGERLGIVIPLTTQSRMGDSGLGKCYLMSGCFCCIILKVLCGRRKHK